MDFNNQVVKTTHFVQKGVKVARALHSAHKIGKMFATAVAPLIK